MSAETSCVRDVARGQRDMATTRVQGCEGQGGKLKPYTIGSQWSCFCDEVHLKTAEIYDIAGTIQP